MVDDETDEPDGEEDWLPSELDLAAMPDFGSALAQAAMVQLPSVGDWVRLGVNDVDLVGLAFMSSGLSEGIDAVMKAWLEKSGAIRKLNESIMASAANVLASTMFPDLGVMAGSLLNPDVNVLGRDSYLRLDGPIARVNVTRANIPPVDFMVPSAGWRRELGDPPSHRFNEQYHEFIPILDSLPMRVDRFYKPGYPLSRVHNAADVPPDDAVLIDVLRVAGGNLTQIGNLFEHYFGPARSPERCFVVRDRLERCWVIYHAKETGRDARERARDMNNLTGYIVVVDLPVATVEFYGVTEKERLRITAFVKQLKERMIAVGFKPTASERRGYGQWSGTEAKIDSLREFREGSRREGRITIGRLVACQLAGIDPKTAKKHAPELYERWEEWEY